jgi:hypothetical protein
LTTELPRLYTDLASWFPLLSAPEEYAEEASLYRDALLGELADAPRTLLELGAGAGSNASHLKRTFECTLTDLSPAMLNVSRKLNPECEHAMGDMRSLRLGRTFDAVLVHDAVMYMLTEHDLALAIETAFVHCRHGGVALFAPDCVRETFRSTTDSGGNDGGDRALRYLEWCWDPDPTDSWYVVDYAYLLREGNDARVVHDRHIEGLFPRATWLRLLSLAGFRAKIAEHADRGGGATDLFVALKPPHDVEAGDAAR